MEQYFNLSYLNSHNLTDLLCEKFVLSEQEARTFVKKLSFSEYTTISEYINVLEYSAIHQIYPDLVLREATADRGINGSPSSPNVNVADPGTQDDRDVDDALGQFGDQEQPTANQPDSPGADGNVIKVEPGIGGKRPNALQRMGNKFMQGYDLGKDPNKAAGEFAKKQLTSPDDMETAKFRRDGTLNPNLIKPGAKINFRDAENNEYKGRFVKKADPRGNSLIIRDKNGQDYEVATNSVFEDDGLDDELQRIQELAGIEDVEETASAGATGAGAIAGAGSIHGDMSHRPSQKLGKKRNEKIRKKKRQIRKDWGND